MQRTTRRITLPVLLLLMILNAYGQDGPVDRLAVAFSDPSRSGWLKASLINGSITVKGYRGDEVIIEARVRSRQYSKSESSKGGLRRIAIASTGLTVEEDNNEMKISAASHRRTIDLNIEVPIRTSLKLSTINSGNLLVEDVRGELELHNTNGRIEAYNIAGSVVANTTNGKVVVTFDRIEREKPMSFVSFNGNVDVTFPEGIECDVKMKSEQGEIYSDFEIELENRPRLVQEDTRRRGGKYKVRVESAMYGTINGGGPEFHFSTYNGNIYIRQQK
ncbi:hypothetical protein MJD09_02755 [bacterium]|nr:hypothetical protein [bacterium]